MRALICIVAIASTACAPAAPTGDVGAATAAVNGTRDRMMEYDGVVGMFIDKGFGVARCSGVLLERNLVLTARHCVHHFGAGPVICGSTPFGAAIVGPNIVSTPEVVMPTGSPDPYVPGSRVLVPPDGNDHCGFDVAAVILAGEIPASRATPFVPRLDEPVTSGEMVTAVGYGSDGSGGLGTRRIARDVSVVCRGGMDCTLTEVQPTEWMATDGRVCFGDSGSPAFDSEDRILGIVSRGVDPCDFPIYGATAAFPDWLREIAREAATEGGYPPPAWAMETAADAGVGDSDAGTSPGSDGGGPVDGGTSAPGDAATPPMTGGDGGCSCSISEERAPVAWMLLPLAALLRRRRR